MPARYDESECESQWDADDPDGPQESDRDDAEDQESETVPCPHCHRPVYEDADRCPHCGQYVLPGHAGGRRGWWPIAAVAATAVLLAAWLLGRGGGCR
jgi:hypothetical protein